MTLPGTGKDSAINRFRPFPESFSEHTATVPGARRR